MNDDLASRTLTSHSGAPVAEPGPPSGPSPRPRRRRLAVTAVLTVLLVGSLIGSLVLARGQGHSASPSGVRDDTPATPPSGVAMPVGDLPGWRQVFTEDFNTRVPLGSWPGPYAPALSGYDGGPDTAKVGVWATRKTVSASHGMADYFLHSTDGVPQAAALLPRTRPQTYGRYSVRFEVDPGLKNWASAWLLWPDDEQWPAHGEVDWPEGRLDGTMSANHHHADPAGGLDSFDSGVAFSSGWHTATTEWTRGLVVFYLDGVEIGRSTTEVPDTPMHWVLQSETAYGSKPAAGSEGHIRIDWAVVYAQA